MKKVLISGGAGFIGAELAKITVSKGYKTIVIDALTYAGDFTRLQEIKDKIKFYKADTTERKAVFDIFKTEKPDIVLHLAAESHVDRSILDPSLFLKTNIIGTQNMLDASKEYGVEKFVNMSTDEVYGELGKDGKFFETTPLNPNSPYSVSKASQDMLGRAYFRTYKLPVITVRASNNYGYWQYPEKLIPVVILKAYNNEKIPVFGRGENVREWLFVTDCAEGILSLAERGRDGEIYNIGSGEEKKNIEVVKSILDLMGKPHSLIEFVKDRPGHDFRYALDFSKIRKEIGWEAKIKFEEGIEKTVKWNLENINWLMDKKKDLERLWEKVYKKQK
ncbi:dTDP-glucose 4,6-dehydratase [Thermotomaculum hydrothermale]|uniref:dTDP-glucose 4,6-dehydratase n=1 Tax=Thermotomaculum hydrothermale TaxID=981385 RepID=A0A7R6PYW2_9BACT|nr:dTDP-glucose 4,6-dehydratase [Thermotomaculum hydrothermale]BBB33410.1 dTDP-glucose 4,6-dehydratase [Thermotomaculum hydrothermale]